MRVGLAKILLFYVGSILFSVSSLSAAVLVVNNAGNAVPITGVSYLVNGVTTVNQTASVLPSATATAVTTSVDVTNIRINDGGVKNLNFYNLGIAVIRNNNFTSATGIANSTGGVGVYDTSSPTVVKIQQNGLAAYEAAVIRSATNTNLMNYLFYDGNAGIQGLPNSTTADYDLLYQYGWTTTDYLVVAERNGNTFFELTPLGRDGNPISGANTLQFNATYGWRSGYENDYDANNGQDMWFSAARISKFFQGTAVALADQVVFGYRIDNNGQADVKFFGASDDPFENNPRNPLIPEPSSVALLMGLGALFKLSSRSLHRR